MASKEILRRALPHWPRDALRPTAQLGAVLASRLPSPAPPMSSPPGTPSSARPPPPLTDPQANAALALLTDRFARAHALAPPAASRCGGIMTPRSNPGYYAALARDLAAAPTRTWLQALGIRLRGLVRWS